ncbi:MAG: hypothetical protein V2I76_15600 [Roseobacter sp.]|nr:hypothetical protein [Roseobacter sp.]
MAAVRAAPDAMGQIVICIGSATSVIFTDSEGRPTQAPHICPDCIVTFADGVTAPAVHAPWSLVAMLYRRAAANDCADTDAPAGFRPRAPPR